MASGSEWAHRAQPRSLDLRAKRRPLARYLASALVVAAAFAFGRWSAREASPRKLDTPAVRQAARLEREVDAVEARLAAGQGWAMEGEDLRRRHQHVSELQCENAKMQLAISARLHAAELRKRARLRAVAESEIARPPTPPAADPAGGGDGLPGLVVTTDRREVAARK